MTPNQPERQRAYETFVLFVESGYSFAIFLAGLVLLAILMTRRDAVWGISLKGVVLFWFFGYGALRFAGPFFGWDKIVNKKRLQGKLKPIPLRGKKIELYEIETGKPLAYVNEPQVQYLIDSFADMGMEDNDFYIMRETVDLFEERCADPQLVATLREMMGDKHDIEIGWTRV